MERFPKADKACAVAAALAHDFNDELTVILSSVSDTLLSLEPGHPARPHLFELRRAAERCAGQTSGLLAYSLVRGVRPSRMTALALLAD